jgi:prevent-host-death family protein
MADQTVERFNIHEAKTNFSRIIDRVEQGQEVIISRAGKPVAKVVPLASQVHRKGRGSLRGRLDLADDWDSEGTNAAIAADFGFEP